MKYRIHYTLEDGSEDSFIVAGGSIEGIQLRAQQEIERRGGQNAWSEEVQS